jgi:hypothetical protein
MTIVNRLPLAELRWQIAPGQSGPLPEENPVDHPTVAQPAPAPAAVTRQMPLQPHPLVI